MKWLYLAFFVCLGVLFFSNPDIDDFRPFIKEEARKIIQDQVNAPGLGDVLSGAGAELAESFVDNVTKRKNYYLFSTYEIDLTPRNRSDKPYTFVGIGGNFISFDKFDAKRR